MRLFRFSSTADAPIGGEGSDVRRRADQARGRARRRARRAGRTCRWPASCSCPTARTRARTSITNALLGMKAQKMPVFTVGVGSEKLTTRHPDRPGHHAAVGAQGRLAVHRRGRTNSGFAGRTVTVDVEDDGRDHRLAEGRAALRRQRRHRKVRATAGRVGSRGCSSSGWRRRTASW